MVIYEVNLVIKAEIYEQFKAWLIAHVKEVLQCRGFKEAKVLLENDNSNGEKKITCHYWVDSHASLENYLVHHAPALRQDGIDKFGNQFSAMRRVFDVAEIMHA